MPALKPVHTPALSKPPKSVQSPLSQDLVVTLTSEASHYALAHVDQTMQLISKKRSLSPLLQFSFLFPNKQLLSVPRRDVQVQR